MTHNEIYNFYVLKNKAKYIFVVKTPKISENNISRKNILKHASTMKIFLSPVCYRKNITLRGCLKIELSTLQFSRFGVLIPASFTLHSI